MATETLKEEMAVTIEAELPQVKGVLKVDGISILFGKPKSGKTWLLKAVYHALFKMRHKVTPRELALLIGRGEYTLRLSISRGRDRVELHCGQPEGGFVCSDRGYADLSAIYIPPFAEAIIKHGWAPPYESYEEFRNLIYEFIYGPETETKCDFSKYNKAVEVLGGKYEIITDRVELYEKTDAGREIKIAASSTAVSKLGFLEATAFRGLLDDYDLLLLDDIEAGLHPMGLIRLALLLHNLASCGKRIIVATHNPHFADMIIRGALLSRNYGVNIPIAPVRLYDIFKGRIVEYDVATSFIAEFTKYLYAPYLDLEAFKEFLKSAESEEKNMEERLKSLKVVEKK